MGSLGRSFPIRQALRLPPDVRGVLAFAAVLLVLDVFVFNDTIRWFARALVLEAGVAKTGLFVLSYLAMVLSCAALLATRALGPVAFGVTFLFLLVDVAFSGINGEPFGTADFGNFLAHYSFTGEALRSYAGAILAATWKALLLYPLLYWGSRRFLRPLGAGWAVLAVLGLIPGAVLTARTVGAHTRAFPRYVAPAYVMGLYLKGHPYTGPRDAVMLERKAEPAARHVLLIVDESVRADLLGFNGYPADNTPFLSTEKSRYLNYGIASSFSNSSSSSNQSLMAGLSMEDLPDKGQKAMHRPRLLDFAARAMASNTFIFGQEPHSVIEKWFGRLPGAFIDIVQENPSLRDYEIDRRITELLDTITSKEGETSFVWVNKWGCHFHYDAAYPESRRVFQPVFDPARPTRPALLNSYSNAVRWAVDDWFRELLSRLEGRNTIIVYTSDHGQSLMEDRFPGTHNRVYDVPSFQASVPILLFGTDGPSREYLRSRFLPQNVGRAAAEQLFPTLLRLMGYDPSEVREHYGLSLLDPLPERPRYFLSGDLFGLGATVRNRFEEPPGQANQTRRSF
jgi:hypothetical protein